MNLKHNRAPHLCYIKLWPLFQSNQWIQTGVTVRKCSIWVQNWQFFVPCDLEIHRMTLKTIGHLFCITSSFVHHFVAISQFKLELQSGHAQFGSKSAIFFVLYNFEIWWKTLKNHRWIIELQSGTPNLGQNRRFSVLCNLEIWWVTLKNNRAPHLCYFKLCASFHSHL